MDFDILSDNILQSPSGKMYPVLSLSQGEETLYLPVTPAKVQIQSAQENKIVDILDFSFQAFFLCRNIIIRSLSVRISALPTLCH